MKRLTMIFLLLFGLSFYSIAQNQTLKGIVLKANEQAPLVQASVKLKKANQTVRTDAIGRFSLSGVVLPDTLVVSYVGYETIVQPVLNFQSLTLVMKEQSLMLEDVIVNTGYQQLAAGRATGSYSLVDSSLFNRAVGTDVFRRLEGITPSILYDKRGGEGNVTRFNIRGLSTLSGGNATRPLIILDDFPYEGDVNNINPNDVESVTLLKDAAASAIWGTRAGNGVLVISTRKAKFNQGLQFNLVSNTSISGKPDLFAYPLMSSTDFLGVEKYLYDKGFYASTITNTRNRPVLSPYVELLEAQKAGKVSASEVANQLAQWSNTDYRNDFDRYFQQNAVKQQYALNFATGGPKLNYVGSFGFDKGTSTYVGDDNQRLSLRNQVVLKPTNHTQISASMIYTQNKADNNSMGAFGTLRPNGGKSNYYPYVDLVDEQGKALAVEQNYRKNYTDTAGRGLLLDWSFRPLDEVGIADKQNRSRDILMNVHVDQGIGQSLKLSIQYRYQNTLGNAVSNYSQDSYFTRDLINRFSSISGNTVTRRIPLGGINDRSYSDLTAHAGRVQLNYQHQWGQHQFEILGGGEIRQSDFSANSNRSYGFDALNYFYRPVDLVNAYPIYGTLTSNSTIPVNNQLSSLTDRNVSYYLNGTYNYGKRYTFSFSARKDKSNLFGVNANQKGVPLGSVGLAWHVNEEDFYHWDALPLLNFRASYGYSGNAINTISALTTIRYDQTFFGITTLTGLPQATIVNPPNPDLRWEKVGIFNTSLDFGTLGNRVSGTIGYFRKNASDLIGQVVVDATTGGAGTQTLNSATLHNEGLEVQLRSINLRKALKWNTEFLFSSSKNTVAKYGYTAANASQYVGSGNITPIVGQTAYAVVSYRWAGLDPNTGDPRVMLNGQASKDYTAIPNQVTFNDLKIHGSAVPTSFGALRNDFSYRNFSLSFNISYKLGYYYRRNGLSYNSLFTQWAGSADYAMRWQQPGDKTKTQVPSLIYPANNNRDLVYLNSDILVEKGDHIKLQDVRLAYAIPPRLIKGIHLRQLSFYAYASNVAILWKASKAPYDPEYGSSYIPIKTITFGLKTDF